MKTGLFKTAIFVTEIYHSIYVCYLSFVSYTHTMHEFAFDKFHCKTGTLMIFFLN